MNLGSFFTLQHVLHMVWRHLQVDILHQFVFFFLLHFILSHVLASWFPAPSAGPYDEFPLHAAQAALTWRGVRADAGHLALLTRYFRRTSAYTWTRPVNSPLTCVFSSTDRLGVTHHSMIDRNQETLALTLKTYIEAKRSEPNKQ